MTEDNMYIIIHWGEPITHNLTVDNVSDIITNVLPLYGFNKETSREPDFTFIARYFPKFVQLCMFFILDLSGRDYVAYLNA